MIAEKWPTLAKFLKNIVTRIDIIGVPIETATGNYIRNIDHKEKEMLIRDTEEFLAAVEENLTEWNELSWSVLSAEQASSYMSKLLEIMRTTNPKMDH